MYIRSYFNLDKKQKKFLKLSIEKILYAIENIDSRKIITDAFDHPIVGFKENDDTITFLTLESYEDSGQALHQEPKNMTVESLIDILQKTDKTKNVSFEDEDIFFIEDDPYATTLKFANDGYAFLKEKDIFNLNQKVKLKTTKG